MGVRLTGEIKAPHPDIELRLPRRPFQYAVTLPEAGLGPDTGLIFVIHGYGGHFDDPYMQKLRPFLADSYDCAVASVDYFGAECLRGVALRPPADFFLRLRQMFGMNISAPAGLPIEDVVAGVLEALGQHGVKELPGDMVFTKPGEQYNSFGVLPALDHLQVAHRLLDDLPVNRRRLFVLGTSYGGYIAQMLNKLAPNSFRLIVDNSGFTSVKDTASAYGVLGTTIRGVRLTALAERRFTNVPGSPCYMSPAFQALRDLCIAEHYSPSPTALYSYHSATDTVAPTGHKVEAMERMRAVRPCSLTVVDESQLDAHCFKTLEHGMQASLRGLFDLSYQRWLPSAGEAPDVTDFDLETTRDFDCGALGYRMRFTESGPVLSLEG